MSARGRGSSGANSKRKRSIQTYEHRDKDCPNNPNNPSATLGSAEEESVVAQAHAAAQDHSPRTKFQALLRELFQFDCADLDFGIYRIMNYKRAVLERFIAQDLPQMVDEELRKDALAEQKHALEILEAAKQKVLDVLGK
ncbi:MAG TPA: hypothetical protein PK777_08910, partial [Thermoguttaceae bacterium]|nr:hypothetical protein [Thermoguttaceae bacterium]